MYIPISVVSRFGQRFEADMCKGRITRLPKGLCTNDQCVLINVCVEFHTYNVAAVDINIGYIDKHY